MKIFKITWALDAFGSETENRTQVLDTVRLLTSGGAVEIHPVYVLSPEGLNLLELPPWLDHKQTQKGVG